MHLSHNYRLRLWLRVRSNVLRPDAHHRVRLDLRQGLPGDEHFHLQPIGRTFRHSHLWPSRRHVSTPPAAAVPCAVCQLIQLTISPIHPCSPRLGRRPVFYLSILIITVGRLVSMFTAAYYVVFCIAAVVGSLTAHSIFQAPLIIAMEISKR